MTDKTDRVIAGLTLCAALLVSGCGTYSNVDVRDNAGNCYRVETFSQEEHRVWSVREPGDPAQGKDEPFPCRVRLQEKQP
jgi:hypothetical protein